MLVQIFSVFLFMSIFILMFWFKFWNLIFNSNTKLLYTDPQLLRQCKLLNYHHVRQITSNHTIVCYDIVCLIMQNIQPICPLTLIFHLICCCCCHVQPGSPVEGGWENAVNGHRTPLTHTHTYRGFTEIGYVPESRVIFKSFRWCPFYYIYIL